jgi:hypothetical protein
VPADKQNEPINPGISKALEGIAKTITSSSNAAMAIARMSPVIQSLDLSKKVREDFLAKNVWVESVLENSKLLNEKSIQLNSLSTAIRNLNPSLIPQQNLESMKSAVEKLTNSLAIVSLTNQLEKSIRKTSLLSLMLERQYPPNWKNTKATFSNTFRIAKQFGLSLAYVPEKMPLRCLLKKASQAEKELILLKYEKSILDSCRRTLEPLSDEDRHSELLLESISAYKRGFFAASQCLSANVIDSTLYRLPMYESMSKGIYQKVRSDFRNEEDIQISSFGGAIALSAVIKSVEHWMPNKTMPIPNNFNRHVTAHQIGSSRIDQATAITAITLGVSLRNSEANGDFKN